MSLREKFTEAVGTNQPLVLVRGEEWDDIEAVVSSVCKEHEWNMVVWDAKNGLIDDRGRTAKQQDESPSGLPANLLPKPAAKAMRPHQGLIVAIDGVAAMPEPDEDEDVVSTILVVRNIHKLWREGDHEQVLLVLQTLQGIAKPFKLKARMVLGVAVPGEMPPVELLPLFTVIDHRLPVKDEFKPVIDCVQAPDEVDVRLDEEAINLVAEASCGLTRLQAEKAIATAWLRLTVDEGAIKDLTPAQFFCAVVEEEKNSILNADGMLKRWDGKETFDDIGGNEALKEYLKLVMRPEARRLRSKRSCALLVGPPGTGKTLAAKALGKFTGRKTYSGNLSSNKSKYVGESEANARRMFARASAMNSLILYFDEINEQVEGGESDGHSVDKALRQYLMEWLDTHHQTDDVYVVMTANDVSKMHMALTRPGRVDAVWYVGLPGPEQKKAIWAICLGKYGLDQSQFEKLPNDHGWAGVEIDACVATAHNFGITLEAASKYIIPSSIRVKEQIERLHEWAEGRCLDAETGQLFRRKSMVQPEETGELGNVILRKIQPLKKKSK